MQIVIDIDDETYADIKKGKIYRSMRDIPQESVVAIANGIPLPKGHGRLIDADKLKEAYGERITDLYALSKKYNPSREAKICATNWCANTIDELPTIIEADKEE